MTNTKIITEHNVYDDDGTVEGSYLCRRCGGTGRFITGRVNGQLVGPGGDCFRCNGKGYHTQADRRRNYGHAMNQRAY